MALTEPRRQQLDRIVQQMIQNKEPDENIRAVVDDFKGKYANEALDNLKPETRSFYEEALSTAGNFVKGIGKGALNTLQGASDIGQKIFGGIAQKAVGGQPVERAALPENLTTPNNDAQKAGFTTEQIGEFFVPGGVATKVATRADKVAKMATESVKLGGISSAQEDNVKDGGQDALVNLAINAAGAGATRIAKPLKSILSETVPSKIMNSIIKPGINDFQFGKNPGGAVVKEGISGKSLSDLFSRIRDRKKEIGSAIESEIGKVKDAKIDISPAISKIDDAIATATDQGEQALVSRLQNIKYGLTKTFKNENGKLVATGDKPLVVSPLEAWKIKQSVGNATKWTGQAFDKEANQARVAVYGAIRDAIESVVPATKKLNQRYANMLTAQKAAERRISVVQRNNNVGFGDIATMGAGGFGGGVAGAAGAYAAKKILGSTAVKSNFAKLLGKIDPRDRHIIEKYGSTIQKIFEGANNDPNDQK